MSAIHKFKKPLDYNPGLAQKTLASVHAHDASHKHQQDKSLCLQLGLDDVMDIEDSEEDDLGEESPTDALMDIAMLAEERESSVAAQGLHRHIKRLCGKCSQAAEAHRKTSKMPELSHLLVEVSYELQQLSQQIQDDALSVENSSRRERDLRQARHEVRDLQDLLRKKEMTIAALESRLALFDSASSHTDGSPTSMNSASEMEALTSRVEELQVAVAVKDQYILEQAKELQELRASHMSAEKESKKGRNSATQDPQLLKAMQQVLVQLGDLRQCRDQLQQQVVDMQKEMFAAQQLKSIARQVRDKEINLIKQSKSKAAEEVAKMQSENKELREQVEHTKQSMERQLKIAQLEAEGKVSYYQHRWKEEFERRRRLHNTVMELKGNIRVLCRVRPVVGKEGENQEMAVTVLDEETLRVRSDKGEREFEFDRTFSPSDDQEAVFQEVDGVVTSSLDGFNVCIMAYGQTGSGKTYTMTGPPDNPGVNTRALSNLFKAAGERLADIEYGFKASILEIYNEQIFDLLLSGSKDQGDKLDVKEGPEGLYVAGLTLAEVSNMEDVTQLLTTATQNRTTFATNMNEHSSRSHLVLSVYITGQNKQTGQLLKSKVHLIDLAGSERLSRTGAQGDRLKEAQNINKSLSALGDVIQALQQKAPHVPYRNSKLTRLLEDSLGGNSKCMMFVNCSPSGENVAETKCSLEFASRARKVELGRARANVVTDTLPSPHRHASPRVKLPNDGSISARSLEGSVYSRNKSMSRSLLNSS